MTDDDYLFDKSGEPDAELAGIERALRPLGRRDDAPVPAFVPQPRRRVRLLLGGALAAAAAVVAVSFVSAMRHDSLTAAPVVASGPKVHEAGGGAAMAVDEWIETTAPGRELLVGDVGRISLGANSRLQLRHVSDETTRLYLARGSLEARVSADARPRFFQVDTDAARCVDLGCRYTLEVADDGAATVRVTTGQVAFETPTREVFVPAGAVCVARKGRGPGTPRFEDARETLVAALDAYDAATDSSKRRDCALAALDAVAGGRDTLPAWHMLQDPDTEVVRAAASKLAAVAGRCEIASDAAAAQIRAAWKDYLGTTCW